jgi:hypothetical protein
MRERRRPARKEDARVPAPMARTRPFPDNADGMSVHVRAGGAERERAAQERVELGFGDPKIIRLRHGTSAFGMEGSTWRRTHDSRTGYTSREERRRVVASAFDSNRTQSAESAVGWCHEDAS